MGQKHTITSLPSISSLEVSSSGLPPPVLHLQGGQWRLSTVSLSAQKDGTVLRTGVFINIFIFYTYSSYIHSNLNKRHYFFLMR